MPWHISKGKEVRDLILLRLYFNVLFYIIFTFNRNNLVFIFQINEFTYDYTFCISTTNPPNSSITCAAELESIGTNNTGHVCSCKVTFTLDKDFEVNLYVY
jgi:hypothetical protein